MLLFVSIRAEGSKDKEKLSCVQAPYIPKNESLTSFLAQVLSKDNI